MEEKDNASSKYRTLQMNDIESLGCDDCIHLRNIGKDALYGLCKLMNKKVSTVDGTCGRVEANVR